jgi:hypothetical protein
MVALVNPREITQRDEKIAIFLKLFPARLGVKRKFDARSRHV